MNKTDIINNALLNIGESIITDVDSSDEFPAEVCKRFYDSSRKIVLKSAEWPFARAEKTLVRVSLKRKQEDNSFKDATYNDKYPYMFSIPNDCIYIEQLFCGKREKVCEDEKIPYKNDYKTLKPVIDWDIRYIKEIGKGVIVCKYDRDVNIIYTTDIIDGSVYEEMFSEALSLYLSYKICVPITKDRDMAIKHLQMFNSFIDEVKTRLLNEVATKTPTFVPNIIKARRGFDYDRIDDKQNNLLR